MAESKFSVNIGAKDLKTLAEYKYSGVVLHNVEKKFLGLFWSNWHHRYVVICKGKVGTWNLVCYLDHMSNKAEATYSMLEFESVKRKDEPKEGITGFEIKFEKTLPSLIFSCDTKDSQMEWIKHIRCAIEEAHSVSKDSAYASGGSECFSEINGISNRYYTIDESDIPDDDDTSKHSVRRDFASGNVIDTPFTGAIHVNDKSGVNVPNDDDQPKHSYKNMKANIHALHDSLADKGKQDGNKKDKDTTDVKHLESYPVQESKRKQLVKGSAAINTSDSGYNVAKSIDQEIAKREGSIIADKHTTKSFPTKSQNKNKAQESETSKKTTTNTKPHYVNVGYGSLHTNELQDITTKMEDLKWKLPTQDNDSISHSQTNVKQIVQGIESRKPTFARQILSPMKEVSTRATTFNSLSFLSVRGEPSSADSESLASVREGIEQSIEVFDRKEYYCPERKNVKRIMKNRTTGTFLVCPSETTSEDVCVMTPCGIKYFRVHKQEGKYSFFKTSSGQGFPSLDCLLSFYHKFDNLPSKDYEIKLTRGYNSKESIAE